MKLISPCIASLLFSLGATALWAIPPGFNIQGRLTDANGVNKNGAFDMKFSIFASPDPNDADPNKRIPAWEKTMSSSRPGSQSVTVVNGNFQVILQGAGDIGGQLEEAVKNLDTAYVEIKVGNEAPMVPRQPLLRSPFSPPGVNLVGAVMFFAGPTCPTGWLLANGAILPDEAIYGPLRDYLQATYGAMGKLPNMLDGSFIRATGGNAAGLGVKQADALKSHTHGIPRRTGTGYGSVTSAIGNSVQTDITTYPYGEEETRPINYAMTPCIKY